MRRSAVVLALMFLLAGVSRAQQPVQPLPPLHEPPSKVFRSSASMVALNVTVTDGAKLVTGLTPADFAVYEDGVQQLVRFFEATAVPLDLVLLLDSSASMRNRMPVVRDAARSFMRILKTGDRGAVVAFNDNVRIVQDLTVDASAIESANQHAAERSLLHWSVGSVCGKSCPGYLSP